MRPLTTLVVLAAALCAALIPTAAARAETLDVICVNIGTCPFGGHTDDTLGDALEEAEDEPGPAKIILAPNPFGVPYGGAFHYSDHGISNNSVILEGTDEPTLTTQLAHSAALTIHSKESQVVGVKIDVPSLPGTDGVVLDGADGVALEISGVGGGSGVNRGAVLSNDASLHTTRIVMNTGFGVELTGGPSEIHQTKIQAPYGILGGASDLRIDRTEVHGEHLAIELVGGSGGNGTTIPDGLLSTRSVLTTTDPDAEAVFARDMPATFVRTTIAGLAATPGPGSEGVHYEALTRSGFLIVARSIVGGYGHTIVRSAAASRLADLTATDGEWKASTETTTGAGIFTQLRSHVADREPRFVDRAKRDLRLRGSDPAVDRNQQAVPDAFNVTDFGNHDPVDGDGDGQAETDAGALEYQRHAPVMVDAKAPASGVVGQTLTFTAKGLDFDGDQFKLAWNFGDGSPLSAGGNATHVYTSAATFDAVVIVTDESGLSSKLKFPVVIAAAPVKPSSGSASSGGTEGDTSGGTSVPSTDAPPTGGDAAGSTGGETSPTGTGTPPASGEPSGGVPADRTAPRILSARLRAHRSSLRRGRRARLTVKLDEAARVRITVVRRRGGRRLGRRITLLLPAGARSKRIAVGHRRLRALARRRAVLSIVAIDATDNRSAPVRVPLRVRALAPD